MQITFNTADLTPIDQQVIALLAGGDWPSSAPVVNTAPAAEPVVKPAPKKAAPKAEPKPEPEPEVAAEPEPEPQEDLLGGEEATPEPEGPTMADAVAAATKLVSSGGASKVKEALATVGAKRVSEIPADSIAAFLSALQ